MGVPPGSAAAASVGRTPTARRPHAGHSTSIASRVPSTRMTAPSRGHRIVVGSRAACRAIFAIPSRAYSGTFDTFTDGTVDGGSRGSPKLGGAAAGASAVVSSVRPVPCASPCGTQLPRVPRDDAFFHGVWTVCADVLPALWIVAARLTRAAACPGPPCPGVSAAASPRTRPRAASCTARAAPARRPGARRRARHAARGRRRTRAA